jgi:hypothetical protein
MLKKCINKANVACLNSFCHWQTVLGVGLVNIKPFNTQLLDNVIVFLL